MNYPGPYPAVMHGTRIYEELKRCILTCELPPGTDLREQELAQRFEVSKSPVREALQHLVRDGRVTVMPRQGYRVSPISLSDARDMFAFRCALEVACIAEAAKNASDEQFGRAVDDAAALLPEAAAAEHLRQLHFLASERGWSVRLSLVQAALDQLGATIVDRTGNHDFWERNVEHGLLVLWCAEATMGTGRVAEALREALTDTTLLDPVLIALSDTIERVDSSTMEFLGIARRYSDPRGPTGGLPQSVPRDALCAAIEHRWPAGPGARGPEIERLAAEFHDHHCVSSQAPS